MPADVFGDRKPGARILSASAIPNGILPATSCCSVRQTGDPVLPRLPIGKGDAHRAAQRQFADAAGLEWTVYDVVNPAAEGGVLGEFLCFERGVDRRRLSPIPADWKDCDPTRLRDYLARARSVHRSFASPDQFRERRRWK